MPDSFEKLIKYKDKYKENLGALYPILDKDFTWFYDLRVVRNKIIHQGSEPLVFCDPEDGILFQVYGEQGKNLIEIPEFMFNSNIVRFELYIAYYFAELLLFLDNLSTVVLAQINFEIKMSCGRNYSMGYFYLLNWMKSLNENLDIQ